MSERYKYIDKDSSITKDLIDAGYLIPTKNELEVINNNLKLIEVGLKDGSLSFLNFDELKEKTNANLAKYKGLVLTDDNKQEIKDIMAQLNKTKSLLNRERIDASNKLINSFKSQVDELISIIDNVRTSLDNQVKTQENEIKDNKRKIAEEYFNSIIKNRKYLDFITFEDVGLRITLHVREDQLLADIDTYVQNVTNDINTIAESSYSERLMSKYRLIKDLDKSIAELEEELEQELIVIEQELENEKLKETIIVEDSPVIDDLESINQIHDIEKINEFNYTIYAIDADIEDLEEFMKSKNIEFKRNARV